MRIPWRKTNSHKKTLPVQGAASHAPVLLSPDHISGSTDDQTATITC